MRGVCGFILIVFFHFMVAKLLGLSAQLSLKTIGIYYALPVLLTVINSFVFSNLNEKSLYLFWLALSVLPPSGL
jgi:hypothetical protein